MYASEIDSATASMIFRVTEPVEVSKSGSVTPRCLRIAETISAWLAMAQPSWCP